MTHNEPMTYEEYLDMPAETNIERAKKIEAFFNFPFALEALQMKARSGEYPADLCELALNMFTAYRVWQMQEGAL